MRSTPQLLALGLAVTLSGCTTWPPRRAPAPAVAGGPPAAPQAAPAQAPAAEPAPASTPADEPVALADPAGATATTETTASAPQVAPPHPLDARGTHVAGAELFGADIADAQGDTLGRLVDLHVEPDGTLDCLVLVGAEGRRAYSGIDLELDELGGLRLASGERCEPKDPLRDGAPYRDLFVGRQTSTVTGQITAVEALEGSSPPVTVIKLRAANNHHHRVLVGPTSFLGERELALAVDQEVAIDGIETRDSKGKLWVAGALRTAGRELRLRAGNGQPAWDPTLLPIRQGGCCRDIDGALLSAFELGRWRVRVDGAPALVPCDVVFDRGLEAVFLVVHVDGRERLVPWSATALEPGYVLALRVGADVVAAAPTLPEVTAGAHDPWQAVRDWWSFAARPAEAAAPSAPQAPGAEAPEPPGDPQVDAQAPSGDGNGLEPADGAQR